MGVETGWKSLQDIRTKMRVGMDCVYCLAMPGLWVTIFGCVCLQDNRSPICYGGWKRKILAPLCHGRAAEPTLTDAYPWVAYLRKTNRYL